MSNQNIGDNNEVNSGGQKPTSQNASQPQAAPAQPGAERSAHQLFGHDMPGREGETIHQDFDGGLQQLLDTSVGANAEFQCVRVTGDNSLGMPNDYGHTLNTSKGILVSAPDRPASWLAALYDDTDESLARFLDVLARPFPHWELLQGMPAAELDDGATLHPVLSGKVRIPRTLKRDADLMAVAETADELFVLGTTLLYHGQIRTGQTKKQNWNEAARYALWALDVWRCFKEVKADHLAKIQGTDGHQLAGLVQMGRQD